MIKQIAIDGYDRNFSYFIVGDSGFCAVVDPGDVPKLEEVMLQEGLKLGMILLTHSHHDHVGGVKELVSRYGVPVYMHEKALGRVDVGEGRVMCVADGDRVNVGGIWASVIYTPGHIDDAVCYLVEQGDGDDGAACITGDTLFVEGCGRADLPGSNVKDLWNSLARLRDLPDATLVYPGHDYGSKPVSDIGWEKKHNKYLLCDGFEEFVGKRMR